MKRAFLQLHVAIFLAGFTGVFGRLITMNEGLLVWYRMLLSSFFLLLYLVYTKKLIILKSKEIISLIGIGALIALHWVFFYGSIKYANVSVGLVCFSMIGFFSSLLSPFILKTKIDAAEVLLGLMAILGVYLIFHFDQSMQTGIILGTISAFLAALFPIFNKQVVDKHSPETISFYELFGGWLLLNALLPVYDTFFKIEFHLPVWSDFLWLLVLSVFCTVWAFNLSVRALKKLSPFTVNLSYNLEPVYGIALAFLLFQEHKEVGTSFFVGLAIIFLTVVIQSMRMWRKSRS
jgi:drug/metabolite transporter (DMT)-like permease